MKLLVTGGAGFIGSNFIHYWLKKYPNDFIVNFDKLTYAGNLENLRDVENNSHYKFVEGDICDLNLVIKTLIENKIDTIVHFAAQSHVDRSILSAFTERAGETVEELFKQSLHYDFVLNNVWGTHILLEAAVKVKDIRFHHISTDEVFGSLDFESKPFNENTPYAPRSPYSASKAGADHVVRAYYHTYGLPITISNCSNNYGPYQFPEKVIPLFITNLLENKKIPVYGKGKNIRDWIHVDDHIRGVDLIIQKGKIGENYCLGGGNELSNLALTRKILNLMGLGEEMIEYVKDRPGHDLRYAIDYSKAKNELGWEPQINFDEGLKQTIEWYKNNPDWWGRIKSGE